MLKRCLCLFQHWVRLNRRQRVSSLSKICTYSFRTWFFSRKHMKNNISISDQHRLTHGIHYDEHEFFYEYLLISPSYQKAHQVMSGQTVSEDVIKNISEWDLVLKTYALCGDVYSMTFLKWWNSIGRGVFYTQLDDGTYTPNGSLLLLKNKINVLTLIKGFVLVNFKSNHEIPEEKRVENWRLAVDCSIPSKWTDQLKANSKKTLENLEARTALGFLVSKKLKEALYIAENAARGQYPSNKPIKSGLTFNYEKINRIGLVMTELFLQELRERNKKRVGLALYSCSKEVSS